LTTNPQVAIVGCGLMGRKRAATLGAARLTVCCDVLPERAAALASDYNAEISSDPVGTLTRPDIDIAIIATSHDQLAPLAALAAGHRKHVLAEKPGARKAIELQAVGDAAACTGVKVRIGFNHRSHRALRKARELVDAGAIGPLMFLRGRYGHGGRPGYDQEWRAKPDRSGGGELLDQGIHLIDLARWFLGDFDTVRAMTGTWFWNMPVEDNAFLLLRTPAGQVASLHASWTEWKNTFSLEIYGRSGKLEISGLGASYGTERLAHYQMTPEMGPPTTTIWEYLMADDSLQVEWAAFLDDIHLDRTPVPGIVEAHAALRVVEQAYREAAR
jgi:predicted dehydrogenase